MKPVAYQHHGFTLWQLPVLRDNYIYVLFPEASHTAWAIDPALAPAVRRHCQQHQRPLAHIWNTHHHWDHTDGNSQLAEYYGCEVWAAASDAQRTPAVTQLLQDGDHRCIDGLNIEVLHLPGHTDGHLAFCIGHALFCGDVLFSAGCGRIFEGTHAQMLHSLARLHALDDAFSVYCAHEYTEMNLIFALKVADTLNDETWRQACRQRWHQVQQLRADKKPSVPSTLAEEKRSNPFLQVWREDFQRSYAQAHGCACDALAVFTHLREWRNRG